MLKNLREEGKTLERWRDAGILLEAYSPGRPFSTTNISTESSATLAISSRSLPKQAGRR